MRLTVDEIRERAMRGGCNDGRICYGVPDGLDFDVEPDSMPYGVDVAAFEAEFPFAAGRVDVEMDRCIGAVPRIVVWLTAGERRLPIPARWRGFQVEQRPPLQAIPLRGGLGANDETVTPPQVDGGIPTPDVQKSEFPVGVAVVVFGIILGGFVLSFFVKRSPAGRWYLGGLRDGGPARTLDERIAEALGWPLRDVRSMSRQSLRELVRPANPDLAREIDVEIRSGRYVSGGGR
jgi:hypothetical protein